MYDVKYSNSIAVCYTIIICYKYEKSIFGIQNLNSSQLYVVYIN